MAVVERGGRAAGAAGAARGPPRAPRPRRDRARLRSPRAAGAPAALRRRLRAGAAAHRRRGRRAVGGGAADAHRRGDGRPRPAPGAQRRACRSVDGRATLVRREHAAAAERAASTRCGSSAAPGAPPPTDALWSVRRDGTAASRCRARSTGSRRCSSRAEPAGGSAAPTSAGDHAQPRSPRRRRAVDLALRAYGRIAVRAPPWPPATATPTRETGVSCSNCGKPICPDCMTPTPVGMRCPDCARPAHAGAARCARMRVDADASTYVLIAINVLMFLGRWRRRLVAPAGTAARRLPATSRCTGRRSTIGHDYYRLITSGFLHAGLLHIGFNMYILYWLGTMLEPALGHVALRRALLRLAARRLVRRAALLARRAHGRRVGRGVRADGRGVRDAARPRDRPDAVAASARSILLNLAISVPRPEHLDRRPPRRPDRRRGRRVRDGPAAPASRRGVVLPVAACLAIGAVAAVAAVAVSGRASGLAG